MDLASETPAIVGPVELGGRAFDVLMALIEARGAVLGSADMDDASARRLRNRATGNAPKRTSKAFTPN
jgi:hypothetical protein